MQGEPSAGVKGLGSLILPMKLGLIWLFPRTFLIRSPIPLAHVLREDPAELQALLQGLAGVSATSCSAPIIGQSTASTST